MKQKYLTYITCFVLLLMPLELFAGEYSVRPFLFDEVVEPRSIIEKTVVLTNDSPNRKYVVYATVNEITVDTTGEIRDFVSPVMTDRTKTVTSWVEVNRGRIEIVPKSQEEVPVTFRINPKAKPGEYHLFLGFVPASNRPAAEQIAMRGEADGVVVKLTVSDQREDSMKISSFLIDRFITGEKGKVVKVEVENTGDIASAPIGEIIYYDSRGVEINSAPFNVDAVEVPPGEKVTLEGVVPLDEAIGRFKANIALQYGEKQKAALYDTTSFYLMPIHWLLIIFIGIMALSIFIVFLLRRAFMSEEGYDEDGDAVAMYVREGHDANPKDHDIDLKNANKD